MGAAKELIDRLWQLFESNRLDELSALLGADCEFKMPDMELRGPQALGRMLGAYRVAFPDLRHRVKHHVESGDTVALELEVSGTHTGPMHTSQGTVAATGNKVVWHSCDYMRVQGGRVVSWHVYHDPTPFMTALGLLPTSAARRTCA